MENLIQGNMVFIETDKLDTLVPSFARFCKSVVQWNLSITTTPIIKSIACDLFSNVF